MPLHLNSRPYGNVYVIRCTGRIVLGDEVRALESALEQGMHRSSRLVLNLAKVDRLDSIGLGLLVRFCTRLGKRGGDLRLASASEPIAALLRLTTLTKLFKLYPTEEEAIASFRKLGALPNIPAPHGTRVLVFDPSADLCVFLQSMLACRGFQARSATNIPEAKHLLSEEKVDVLLFGPGTAQSKPAASEATLAGINPEAAVLYLPSDFKTMDAHQATMVLLALLKPEIP